MTRLWKAFVLVVALAAVACEAIRRSRYEDIVNQAIEGYNNGRPGKPLFRLVDYTVLPLLTSTSIILLEFRIKETECLSFLDTQHQNCSFLEDGEERNCTGQFLRRWWSTSLTSICDRDCSREAALLYNYPDYPVEDLPSEIRNIYENAKFDIINNILRNF
ncbi:LOW QUALITY PROTEIN: neutrophilic granule protein-like [Arvicola amphibius]|uniref:LOW QUALITY PROTEIN: neutrophilic granule protein-like n=1 Tax=Arvicola amphibius TaxID=1047088 RepID=UPI0018E3F9B8|nr:LOW QUALITY PROTEIN: neutrophilic granule protein-like [Arvicola amphibius]